MWLKITRQIAKPKKDACFIRRTAQQINGREGETAAFLSRCPLNFCLCVGGFAPRHLNRSLSPFEIRGSNDKENFSAYFSCNYFDVSGIGTGYKDFNFAQTDSNVV